MMAFMPAMTLASFWLGGEQALVVTALGLPVLAGLIGAVSVNDEPFAQVDDPRGRLVQRPQITEALDSMLSLGPATGLTTACLVVQFDDAEQIAERYGQAAQADVLQRCADRTISVLRHSDTIARLDGGGLAIALGPVLQLDLESMIQMATRLQKAVSPAISVDATRIYVTCSIGFCLLGRAPQSSGQSMLDAAQIAADAALRHGPASIRSYSPDMGQVRTDRVTRREVLEQALDQGQIRAHFQPQVAADSGEISGFEALARWHHPERGIVPPLHFLPALEEAGLLERLGEVILHDALNAVARWDRAGHVVPSVSVNFSAEELRNAKLPDKIKWELDRFSLEPERLTIEILETVVTEADNDMIVRNVAALSAMGCGIDLDDFGTGHASITNIRRFALRRLKIDRSFVTRVDEDRDQQKVCSAILSMAERLGLETLGEGVETPGEQAMLAQMGCGHVQGFGIGRPMPYEDTAEWMLRHRARLTLPRIGLQRV